LTRLRMVCGYLVLLMVISQVAAFTGMPRMARVSLVVYGGGKTAAEAPKTQKAIFRELRGKLNEAASKDGFFDTNEKEALEVELFCKAAKDGNQIGDCPFAQFIQMVMLRKGLAYTVRPTLSDAKPDFVSQLPTLRYKGEVLTDSLAIAEFLEKTFPHNTLTRQGAFSYQEVLEKTAGFFPAMSAWIKNKDEGTEAGLQAAFEAQLDLMDEIVRSTPGQYICGIETTLADLYLAPQFFHGMAALEHFKDFQFYHIDGMPTRPALENYIGRLFDMEEFNNKKAYYSVDQVISGWKTARGD